MSDISLIYDDPREIAAIWFPGENAGGYQVGDRAYKCTKIVAYKEHGVSDFTPYYAVYEGKEIKARVPAYMVTVVYGASLEVGR